MLVRRYKLRRYLKQFVIISMILGVWWIIKIVKNAEYNGYIEYPDCSTLTEGKCAAFTKKGISNSVNKFPGISGTHRICPADLRNAFSNGLLCRVQKAGTSNIKHYLNSFDSLTGSYNYSFNDFLKDHRDVRSGLSDEKLYAFSLIEDVDQAKSIMKDYYKIVFFREPLERLVSSYRFFFSANKEFRRLFLPEIAIIEAVRNIRNSGLLVQNGSIPHLTINEYFTYLLNQKNTFDVNPHWQPQMIHTMPCDMDFDFIGRTESLTCEMNFLIKRLTGSFPKVPMVTKPSSSRDSDRLLLKSVSQDVVSAVLNKHFKIDYDFLGIPMPDLSEIYNR